MTILSKGGRSYVEMVNIEAYVIHFGMASLFVTIDDLRAIAMLFDESKGMPDESICFVQRLETGRFLFCFKAVTMQFCSHSLARFASLLTDSVSKIDELFGKPQKFSPDIEELCASIERSV